MCFSSMYVNKSFHEFNLCQAQNNPGTGKPIVNHNDVRTPCQQVVVEIGQTVDVKVELVNMNDISFTTHCEAGCRQNKLWSKNVKQN